MTGTKRDITLFPDELENFKNNYANRYCIYWYRYNAGYENSKDRYLPKNWERLPKKEVAPQPGMPHVSKLNAKTYEASSTTPYSNIQLDVERKTEKFKAILFFNHA
jgi:hypothetical protein